MNSINILHFESFVENLKYWRRLPTGSAETLDMASEVSMNFELEGNTEDTTVYRYKLILGIHPKNKEKDLFHIDGTFRGAIRVSEADPDKTLLTEKVISMVWGGIFVIVHNALRDMSLPMINMPVPQITIPPSE